MTSDGRSKETLKFDECLRTVKSMQSQAGGDISGIPIEYGRRIVGYINEFRRQEQIRNGRSGDSVDFYQFQKFLGAGGEAVVFSAFSQTEGRTIVIKAALPYINAPGKRTITKFSGIKRPKLTTVEENNKFRRRFARGLDIQKELAGLIPRDIGKVPAILRDPPACGPVFVEMELIRGKQLMDYVRGRELHDKLEIFAAILLLVHKIHSYCVIHRDLKTYNWMIEETMLDGTCHITPVLLDFGIAKAIHLADINPITLELDNQGKRKCYGLGTIHYASPEQLADAGNVDYATDVFTIGQVLLDILTEKFPNEHRPGIDTFPELRDIFHKATEKDKRKRYPTIMSLHRDLVALIANLPRTPRKASWTLQDIDRLPYGRQISLWYDAIKKIEEESQ